MLLLGGCAREPLATGDREDDGSGVALYIPAPERVETYSGATVEECRIDNAVVLSWNKTADVVTGAEVVDLVFRNGTQQPTLRLRSLAPQIGETVVVLCNLDPTDLASLTARCVGRDMTTVREQLKSRSAAGGSSADMKAPLTMAGEAVWNDPAPQVRMVFQCAKISVVLSPSLTEAGGPLSWTVSRSTYLDRMPACSPWQTASMPALQNEEGTLWQIGMPGYAPDADPTSFPASYTYETARPADWPATRAFNYILLRVSDSEQGPMQYYCLTYDETEPGRIKNYRPFERGKHYIFRVKEIYKRGYDSIEEALDNPSSASYQIEVSDDWSKNYEYNGQYGVTADRDTAYMWSTTEAQPLYRFSWPRPAGDASGAPATSVVKLLQADRQSVVPVSAVQLLDEQGEPIADNTFTFASERSPEDGYPFSFRTAADAPKQGMWLHVRCGNIEKFVPVGWVTLSAPHIEASYTGGLFVEDVECSATMPDGTTRQMDWSARLVDENGAPVQCDWVTVSDPATDGSSIEVDVAPQKNSDVIMIPGPAVDGYDLSTRGGQTSVNTANCYIVNAPGTYSLPLVYGNAIVGGQPNASAYTSTAGGTTVLNPFVNHKGAGITDPYIYNNGISIADAKLLWQDVYGLIDKSSVELSADKRHLTFRVTDRIDYGNAVLAVFDDAGAIAWSWHIWATDYDPYGADGTRTVQNRTAPNTELDFMLQNLGWCPDAHYKARSQRLLLTETRTGASIVVTIDQTEASTSGNNPFYQWGRKDPFPGLLSGDANKPTFGPAEYIWPSTGRTAGDQTVAGKDIKEYIKYPYKYCSEEGMTGVYLNLWSSDINVLSFNTNKPVKTVYDPSPAGFVVPPGGAYTGFTSTGGNSSSGSQFNVYDSFASGWNIYCGLNRTGETIFFPASGFRNRVTGETGYSNFGGYYWVSGSYSATNAYNLTNRQAYLWPQQNHLYGHGFTVRSIKE